MPSLIAVTAVLMDRVGDESLPAVLRPQFGVRKCWFYGKTLIKEDAPIRAALGHDDRLICQRRCSHGVFVCFHYNLTWKPGGKVWQGRITTGTLAWQLDRSIKVLL